MLQSQHEELVVPFGNGATRDTVPSTSSFRSTWLTSSLRSLRSRGMLDEYLRRLPKEHHESIANSVAGVWLPSHVAVAHYAACETFDFSESELLAIGAEVGEHVYSTVLGTVVRLAKGAGVTPWTVIARFPPMWNRVWVGGGVAVYKVGPKDARLEVGGWQCSSFRYTRVAMRGVVGGLIELFCQKAFVQMLPRLCTASTLGYRIAWA